VKFLRFAPHLLAIAGSIAMLFVARLDGIAAIALLTASAAAMMGGAATVNVAATKRQIWLVGAVIAAIGLAGTPLFEDDYYRYLWDGFRTATTGSPYGIAPEHFFFDDSVPDAFRSVLDRINNPEVATIYGPVLEGLFYLGFVIDPGNERLLRLFWAIANLGLTALLLRKVSAHRVALYAWNPLVLKEVYLSGHPDAVLALLLCAGWLLSRKPLSSGFGIALGLAAGVKVVAFAALPLLLGAKHPMLAGAAAVMALVLTYLPFLLIGGAQSDLDGLLVFAQRWEFNPSPLFVGVRFVAGEMAAKVILAASVMGGAVWLLGRRSTSELALPPLHIVFGAVLLVAPVVNPWYLLWGLPAAVAARATWPWAASFALLLSGLPALDPFAVHPLAYWAQWSLILGAAAFDIRRYLARCWGRSTT
jgi:hypothetical protein